MTSIRTSNNPEMLEWAREEVGYTLEQAAHAIGVSVDKLKAAESGDRSLTLNQLRTAADKYNCPFGYFYLSKPPYKKSYKPVPDYRIEPGFIGVEHYRLNLEIKKARDRRLLYFDLLTSLDLEAEPFQPLPQSGMSIFGSPIRRRLGIADSEISSLDFDQVYSYWKTKIENDGVLVYESQYIPEESGVIGVAIYYDVCPIILVKRGGSHNARKLFTLLHEYAHLLKGQSALNDVEAQSVSRPTSKEARLEAECNLLAAEILVPSENINRDDYIGLNPVQKMEHLANTFKVTYTTAAVCLRRLNLIDQLEFFHLLELRRKANEEKRTKEDKEVKIPRENIMRLDIGRPMFNVVLQAYGSGVIDLFDASKILNLRVSKIDKLVSGIA
jgi:Zn-dependent peptidase ImmA (M78 family)